MEHFLVLFLFGFYFDIMDEQEEEVSYHKNCRDQIHIYKYDLVWSCLVGEALQWAIWTHTTVILCNNQRWDSIIEESCIRGLLQPIDIIWDMVSRWVRRLHRIKMMYRLIQLFKAQRKDLICDFPKRLGVFKKPLYKGPACCIHWALGALRACGSY